MSVLFWNTIGHDDLGYQYNILYLFIYQKIYSVACRRESVESKYDIGLLETKTYRVGIKTFQSMEVHGQYKYM